MESFIPFQTVPRSINTSAANSMPQVSGKMNPTSPSHFSGPHPRIRNSAPDWEGQKMGREMNLN